tara:strand:- start:7713 stop:8132 length:420 start_codon:yes stop_codon:yes gene_type:complete
MPRKKRKPEEIVAKLRQVDVAVAQGVTLSEAVRGIGVSDVTYHRWRNEYGGLKLDQVKRLKELEQENTRLRRAVSDLTLDKLILQESLRGNRSAPPAAARRSGRRARGSASPSAAPAGSWASRARPSAGFCGLPRMKSG